MFFNSTDDRAYFCARSTSSLLWHYGVGVPSRRSLGLFWRKPQTKAWARYLRSDRKRGEERQVREKTEGQLAKEPWEGELAKGDAERQSTTEGRGERSALSGLSRECQSQQKSERRLLKPDELHRGRANQREKMSTLLVPFCRSFTQNTHQRYSKKCTKSCSKSSQNFLSYA